MTFAAPRSTGISTARHDAPAVETRDLYKEFKRRDRRDGRFARRRRGHGEQLLVDPVFGPAFFDRARLVRFG